jgi:PilZ domain
LIIVISVKSAILKQVSILVFPPAGKDTQRRQRDPADKLVNSWEKGMAFIPAERRRYRRSIFPSTIEYEIRAQASGEKFKGVAVNISESGLCLYTSDVLEEGQEIAIKSVLPVPSRAASVRWIKSLNEDLCKVGLMFVK